MDLFGISGLDTSTLALILGALALLVAFARRGGKTTSADAGAGASAGASASDVAPEVVSGALAPTLAPDGQLVAVIAAAVAAASGMAPGSFRIAGIAPQGCESGFSTPIWGHVDRITRTPFKA
ncbi:MAG: hypothetical protein Q8M76_16235 [Spirochaetaceae bacterium]|nr:hypothetical protein [Spirochaetaceae bacterium]